jgi:hypothetical protein
MVSAAVKFRAQKYRYGNNRQKRIAVPGKQLRASIGEMNDRYEMSSLARIEDH